MEDGVSAPTPEKNSLQRGSSPRSSADNEPQRISDGGEERFGPGLSGSNLATPKGKKGKGKREPLLGSRASLGDSDDEDNVKVWQKTSRVQVTGYLPDLQPLLKPGNYKVEVAEDGRMIFKKDGEENQEYVGAPTPLPATPVLSMFKRSPGGINRNSSMKVCVNRLSHS
jgi:hypothetical protein